MQAGLHNARNKTLNGDPKMQTRHLCCHWFLEQRIVAVVEVQIHMVGDLEVGILIIDRRIKSGNGHTSSGNKNVRSTSTSW